MNTCPECGEEFYEAPATRHRRTYCSRACRAKAQSKWQQRDLATRFYAKVEKTETCWMWLGAKLKTGYGSIGVNGKTLRAHRVSYTLEHGDIPDGMLLRHSCDNPLCVNPSHLILGTKTQNTQDALERGQHVVGESHHFAKIPNQAIATIRAALSAGVSGKYLAKQFGVAQSTISQIKNNTRRRYA